MRMNCTALQCMFHIRATFLQDKQRKVRHCYVYPPGTVLLGMVSHFRFVQCSPALDCTMYFTALHCTALHCTALKQTALLTPDPAPRKEIEA